MAHGQVAQPAHTLARSLTSPPLVASPRLTPLGVEACGRLVALHPNRFIIDEKTPTRVVVRELGTDRLMELRHGDSESGSRV